jgi:uncharacterized membrane protein YkvA (DUF1232 family)
VPFFSTSRDAAKYERLKIGLALYRLVFGQVNQEDLLESLQQQTEGLSPDLKDAKLRRLRSYMLNLSPIGRDAARRHSLNEADDLLRTGSDYTGLRELLRAVRELQSAWENPLREINDEINGLVRMVERAIDSGNPRSAKIRRAVAALAYLRNPYDHIFDLHVEGGFIDDIEVIREAWVSINKGAN